MNKLYDQLLFNWERGFYSVVKDNNGLFWIVSTKMEDLGTGGFRRSLGSNDIEECKASVGSSALTGEQIDTCEEKCGWKIVDTIHPSELMGKGFQVGDKVLRNSGKDLGTITWVVTAECGHPSDPIGAARIDDTDALYSPQELKPVLPVEEERHICGHLGLLYLSKDAGGYICHDCGEEVAKAIKLLKEKGIIKDGKIVNL